MRAAYIGLYTLTDALRAGEILKLRRIRAKVVRMPAGPGISCAYGLKLRDRDAGTAAQVLEENGLRLGKTLYRRERTAGERDLF